jgi:signal transduction histidine kinase
VAFRRTVHVSVRALHSVNAVLERNGIPLEQIYSRTPFGLDHVLNPKNKVTWDELVRTLELVEEALGGPERVANALDRVDDLPGNELITAFTRYFTSPAAVYWAAAKWARLVFPCVTCDYEKLPDGRIRTRLRIDADQAGSEPFMRFWINGWRTGLRPLGLPNSVVESSICARESTYLITPPPSRTLWNRGRALVGSVVAARATIQELTRQSEERESYYRQLLETQYLLTEQEKKVELSAQLSALSSLAALGEMAAAISHEINNPVMILYLKSGLLRRRIKDAVTDPAARETLLALMSEIDGCGARIASITDKLLAFAGETHGEASETVEARALIEDALKLCGEKLRNSGIRLIAEPVALKLKPRCNRAQIVHVLVNLLNNSYDALQELPIEQRWVRIDAAPAASGKVQLSVSDGGPGIPPASRERVFEPFYTTKEFGKGPGLGLSVARGLAQANQGALELDPGAKGARFVVTLPAVAAG